MNLSVRLRLVEFVGSCIFEVWFRVYFDFEVHNGATICSYTELQMYGVVLDIWWVEDNGDQIDEFSYESVEYLIYM